MREIVRNCKVRISLKCLWSIHYAHIETEAELKKKQVYRQLFAQWFAHSVVLWVLRHTRGEENSRSPKFDTLTTAGISSLTTASGTHHYPTPLEIPKGTGNLHVVRFLKRNLWSQTDNNQIRNGDKAMKCHIDAGELTCGCFSPIREKKGVPSG